MEQKHGKCWKLPIFEKKLWLFGSYLSEMKSVSMFYNFLIVAPFTVWRYLNSYMTSFFFVRHSASIFKFKWIEQLCIKYIKTDNEGPFHVMWCKPGHDPSQNLIKICLVITICKLDNPDNFRLIIYCMD